MKKIVLLVCLMIHLMAQEPLQPLSTQVVILGGGIGGLTSAIYLGRADLQPVLIEGQLPGGALSQSHSVQNWPGELEIQGSVLAENLRKQSEMWGAKIVPEEVVSVDFSKRPFLIQTKSMDAHGVVRTIRADACIIAMGSQPNFLGVEGESKYWGRGVTNCAICDGNLYRDRVVGVVGGGDAAVVEALYLSKIAKKVFVFVRKGSFKATEKKRIEELLSKSNVTVMYNTEVVEVKGGKESLTHVSLKSKKKLSELALDGLFLAIGSKPNTSLFAGQLKLDKQGYIVVKKGGTASIPGVYAVGDIADPIYRQAITAAGDGAKAALELQQYLSDRPNVEPEGKKKISSKIQNQSSVVEIQSEDQFRKEVEENDLVIVDFYATWCGPCKRFAPVFESAAQQLQGRVKFLKVNVDKLGDLSRDLGIRAMPTTLLFSSGEVVEKKVGPDQIVDLLHELEKR